MRCHRLDFRVDGLADDVSVPCVFNQGLLGDNITDGKTVYSAIIQNKTAFNL